jgi:hypothetical protein
VVLISFLYNNTNFEEEMEVTIPLSLAKMKERIHVLVAVLTQMQEGNIPVNPTILQQVQGLLCSLGPLSLMVEKANGEYRDL